MSSSASATATARPWLPNVTGKAHPLPRNCWSSANVQPPIITVKQPRTMLPPCAVWSPSLAAGMLPMVTVPLPAATVSGGPVHVSMSPTRSAGMPPIKTVGSPGGSAGPPTCGTTPVTIGHTCMSPARAAGGTSSSRSIDHDHRALHGQLTAARDLRLAAAFDRGAAGRLDFRVHRFDLQIRFRLDLHGLLRARQRDAVLVHHDRVAVLILQLEAAVVVAQREPVAARRLDDRDLLLVIEPKGHLAARDVSLLVVVVGRRDRRRFRAAVEHAQ